MALHQPTQFLDYIYKENQNPQGSDNIYLRATINIDLDINEYIPSPIVYSGSNPDFTIDLPIMGNPSDDQDGWYTYPVTVIIPLTQMDSPGDAPDQTKIDLVRGRISKDLGNDKDSDDDGTSEYSVTAIAKKTGETDKEVKTHISENGDIELD